MPTCVRTPTPSCTACARAPCRATAPGPPRRSRSSAAGATPARRPEPAPGHRPRRRKRVRMNDKGRLETFTDGVIAIAITLLVLDLKLPPLANGQTLSNALLHHWPSYLAYLVSFLVI